MKSMLQHPKWLVFAACCSVVIATRAADEVDVSKLPLPVPRKVDFATDVWPLLSEKCLSCHGEKKQKGKYRVDSRDALIKSGKNAPNVLVGNSEKSTLVHMIGGLIEEGLMPPPGEKPGESVPLTKEQIGLIRAWIDQGADWPDGGTGMAGKPLAFAADISPILNKSCAECHSAQKTDGGFSVETRESIVKGGEFYGRAVRTENAERSPLVIIARGLDEDLPFPKRHRLTEKEASTILKWIQQGAK